jgi:hypothetical protein
MMPTPPRGLWTINEFVVVVQSATPDERERLTLSPVLLLSPQSPPVDEEVVHTAVGIADVANARPGGDRLVVRLSAGPLNSTPGRLTLGRSSVCDIMLPFSEVSKVHAYLLHVTPSGCDIEDAGSTNGTEVAGKRLKAHGKASLRDGVAISIGGLLAEFRSAESFRKEFLGGDSAPGKT